MITIDSDGTITLYQGDSGELVISGFDNTKKYTVYFAIQDKKRKFVGKELQVSVNNSDTATFVLTPNYTDLLSVPQNRPYELYYYGIKVSEVGENNEDTLFIGDSSYGDLNYIVVYPRKVEGKNNESI